MAQDNDNALLRRPRMRGAWLAREDRRNKGWSKPWLPSPRESEREDTLADFVGEERVSSVFASLRPGFHDAGQLASSIVGKLDLKSKTQVDELAENWAGIVGADNASQCRPLSVENGILSIEVFSSTWLYVLNGMKSMILQRVSEFTSGAVKRIHLVPQGSHR